MQNSPLKPATNIPDFENCLMYIKKSEEKALDEER
jgi:hypothetical protein